MSVENRLCWIRGHVPAGRRTPAPQAPSTRLSENHPKQGGPGVGGSSSSLRSLVKWAADLQGTCSANALVAS